MRRNGNGIKGGKTLRNGHLLRNLLCLLAVLVLMGCPQAVAFASQNDQVIISDDAALLSGTEPTSLLLRAQEFADKTGWDVRLVTTDDAGGRSSEEFLEDFYMDHYRQDNGVAYLIDMDNREIHLTTSGDAIYYLTDIRIDAIMDAAYEYVSNEAYADTFRVMMNMTLSYFDDGIDPQQYTFDRDTGKIVHYVPPKSLKPIEIVLSVLAGLAGAFGLGLGVHSRYRMKSGKYRYALQEHSNVSLQVRTDQLVNRFVTTRRIPQQDHSSGGSGGGSSHRSTTHSGSGGHSFGGGGRKF